MKYFLLLTGIFGAAAGLNLSVIGLGSTAETTEVATQDLIAQDIETTVPQTVQLTVDVPVVVLDPAAPGEGTLSDTTSAAGAIAAPPAVASVSEPVATPADTSAPTAPPTTKAVSQKASAPQAPATTLAPSTTRSPATTAAPTTQAPTTTGPAPVTEYLYYSFSGIASQIIVADHEDSGFEFWSVATEDGWGYMVEKDRANHVEIKFSRVASGGEGEAKFEIIREGGDIRVKREMDD